MPLAQSDLETLRQGVASVGAPVEVQTGTDEDGDPVYRRRRNLVGAVNTLERIAAEMDDFGVTDPANLPDDRQQEYTEAAEDLRHWLVELANLLAVDLVGSDDSIELENGKDVALPGTALGTGGGSADLPDRPSGGGS